MRILDGEKYVGLQVFCGALFVMCAVLVNVFLLSLVLAVLFVSLLVPGALSVLCRRRVVLFALLWPPVMLLVLSWT